MGSEVGTDADGGGGGDGGGGESEGHSVGLQEGWRGGRRESETELVRMSSLQPYRNRLRFLPWRRA